MIRVNDINRGTKEAILIARDIAWIQREIDSSKISLLYDLLMGRFLGYGEQDDEAIDEQFSEFLDAFPVDSANSIDDIILRQYCGSSILYWYKRIIDNKLIRR